MGSNWIDLAGGNSPDLDLGVLSLDDDGRKFRCAMTSTWFPGTTVYTQGFQIKVIIVETFYAIADGNWSDPAIWSLTEGGSSSNQVPTEFDRIEIGDYQIEVTNEVDCREVNINASASTLLLVSGSEAKLTVNGEVRILNQGAEESKILQVINGGKLECR